MREEFTDVLINRDKMRKDEALAEKRRARREIYDMIASGASYDDVEDYMASEFGLEMDYIDDLI